jgi:hypothetical protein
MRTTISLDDGLGEDIRRRAAAEGTSVSALIESLLREALHRPRAPAPPPRFRLITTGRGGLCPGVELDRAARLLEDEEAERRANLHKLGR